MKITVLGLNWLEIFKTNHIKKLRLIDKFLPFILHKNMFLSQKFIKKCFSWHGIKENNKIQLFPFHNFCFKHTSACLLPRIVKYIYSPERTSRNLSSLLWHSVRNVPKKLTPVNLSSGKSQLCHVTYQNTGSRAAESIGGVPNGLPRCCDKFAFCWHGREFTHFHSTTRQPNITFLLSFFLSNVC